jgi:hypothetical protein
MNRRRIGRTSSASQSLEWPAVNAISAALKVTLKVFTAAE